MNYEIRILSPCSYLDASGTPAKHTPGDVLEVENQNAQARAWLHFLQAEVVPQDTPLYCAAGSADALVGTSAADAEPDVTEDWSDVSPEPTGTSALPEPAAPRRRRST